MIYLILCLFFVMYMLTRGKRKKARELRELIDDLGNPSEKDQPHE